MPASIAAPMSETCTCTFHSRPVGVSTPTTTRLSPSAASRVCSRATDSSSASASRYCTSLPGPGGGWCGTSRESARWVCACPASRRVASGGRAGSTPVTVVTRASRTAHRPAPPASTTPASRSAASWSGVPSSAVRAPSAAAVTTSASVVRPSATQAIALSAPPRATVRKVPSSGSATAVYAVSAALSSAAASAGPSAGGWPASWSARPRISWARIVPELPRAPRTAPRESTDQAGSVVRAPSRSRAVRAACAVSSRFVPVSPSGTGKTFIASRRPRASDSASTAVRHQLADRGLVQRLQHGRRVPVGGGQDRRPRPPTGAVAARRPGSG